MASNASGYLANSTKPASSLPWPCIAETRLGNANFETSNQLNVPFPYPPAGKNDSIPRPVHCISLPFPLNLPNLAHRKKRHIPRPAIELLGPLIPQAAQSRCEITVKISLGGKINKMPALPCSLCCCVSPVLVWGGSSELFVWWQ